MVSAEILKAHEVNFASVVTLEEDDVLLRDSIQNSVAVVQSRAYQRKRNGLSGVLVGERICRKARR